MNRSRGLHYTQGSCLILSADPLQDGGGATELAGAATVAAAATDTAAEETPMAGTISAAEEGIDLWLSAEAQVIVPSKEAPQEGASGTAPGGGIAGENASPLVRGELPATEELPDQPVVTGWDIVVSGSALA